LTGKESGGKKNAGEETIGGRNIKLGTNEPNTVCLSEASNNMKRRSRDRIAGTHSFYWKSSTKRGGTRPAARAESLVKKRVKDQAAKTKGRKPPRKKEILCHTRSQRESKGQKRNRRRNRDKNPKSSTPRLQSVGLEKTPMTQKNPFPEKGEHKSQDNRKWEGY